VKDRGDYRVMPVPELLREATETGINPEMAIALADHLAHRFAPHRVGGFHFNEKVSV